MEKLAESILKVQILSHEYDIPLKELKYFGGEV